MARLVDTERRRALLDQVVAYLAEHGIANLSLRPLARSLDMSANSLMHHFGSKDELVAAALRRAVQVQDEIEREWLRRRPDLDQADLIRLWWRWITSSPDHLAVVRLGLEAAAIEATVEGLPKRMRSEQITRWRMNIEHRLISAGVPGPEARIEASIVKATFTGLVVDLLATGQKARLGEALELSVRRLELVLADAA